MENTTTSQIVKEVKYDIDNFSEVIKARILKISGEGIQDHYTAELSHFYRPKDGIDTYRPSTSSFTLEGTKSLIDNYVKGFENCESFIKNPNF